MRAIQCEGKCAHKVAARTHDDDSNYRTPASPPRFVSAAAVVVFLLLILLLLLLLLAAVAAAAATQFRVITSASTCGLASRMPFAASCRRRAQRSGRGGASAALPRKNGRAARRQAEVRL